MVRSGVTVLSLTVLLAVLEIGSCLRCYQCNSQSNPDCADPFAAKKYLVDCTTQDSVNYNKIYLNNVLPRAVDDGVPGAERYCHKIVLQSGTTVRTCLDASSQDMNRTCHLMDTTARLTPTDERKQIKHCSVCNKEGCNGAGAIVGSLPLAALALIASYLYCKQ